MSLGAALQRLRGAAGLDQLEVATRIGVSRVTVSNWETGKWAPSEANLAALAALYGVSRAALRYGSENGADHVREEAAEPYLPNPELQRELPPRARMALLGYMRRLEGLGLSHEELARLETQLARSRYGQRFSRREGRPLTEGELIELMEDTWDAISEALSLRGPRP